MHPKSFKLVLPHESTIHTYRRYSFAVLSKFVCAIINFQVLSFLVNDSNVHENMMLPKLDTFVLLTNEGPVMDKRDEHWSKTKLEMMACARGTRTELQVMISGL